MKMVKRLDLSQKTQVRAAQGHARGRQKQTTRADAMAADTDEPRSCRGQGKQAPRRKDGVTNETAKARRKDADGNKNDRRRRPESAC